MKTNLAGLGIIKRYEGNPKKGYGPYLKAYKCPAGIWTIGWGHTGDVKDGDWITPHQADAILEFDLDKFEQIVDKAVQVELNPNQYSALVSFVFNVGPGRKAKAGDKGRDGFVTLKNGNPSSLLRKVNAGAFLGAAEEFAKWNKGGGVVLNGLVKRRADEKKLFLTAVS